MAANPNPQAPIPAVSVSGSPSHGEAPASWNVRYLLNGFDCQLTLRGVTGADVLVKSREALKWLADNGAEPTRLPSNSQAPATAAEPKRIPVLDDGSPDPTWCPIHSVAMKRHEKDGTTWYSHKAGESWCRGKPAK